MVKKLKFKNIALPGHSFYLARMEYYPGTRFVMHTHDFAEITWVESGEGQMTVNGKMLRLKAGDIFFSRPHDVHSVSGAGHSSTLTNFTFPVEAALAIEERYAPDMPRFFGRTDKMPWSTNLDEASCERADQIFQDLAAAPRDRFELDRGLMNLFELAQRPTMKLPLEDAPDWLRCAVFRMGRAEVLSRGLPEFLSYTGRSPEHTSRELKKYTGKTPTEFINDLRIEHAARLLCITSKSVLDIALECGFENQGWFHRCFRKRFEVTPLQYRKKNRAPMA
ncbi:helix-turn-helix domain-containing protein [Kiritimatiella glycovorans]|uniref:AraC family transcriptional regulator n=1 Tax=Kiritimatiella glycovorans TaxID=1307763 RepID=A0A0G3EJ01_9BACT|nr:AraC family transcriptional regulator [Kiritimatiella glycovorans]AKJ64159.1 AraC family transcriptional regulator [Kiritimatiella glycovorans]